MKQISEQSDVVSVQNCRAPAGKLLVFFYSVKGIWLIILRQSVGVVRRVVHGVVRRVVREAGISR